MESIEEIPNIGKTIAYELKKIGINSYEELEKIGSIGAIIEIMKKSDKGCVTMLYALEGAVRKIRRREMPQKDKDYLKQRFRDLSVK